MAVANRRTPMPRRPTGPVYFPSKNGYFVNIGKVRYRLATGPKDDPDVLHRAREAYHKLELATLRGEIRDGDREPCFWVLNAYADWVRNNRAEMTVQNRTPYFQWFSDAFGTVRSRDLTKAHALRHMDARWRPDQFAA